MLVSDCYSIVITASCDYPAEMAQKEIEMSGEGEATGTGNGLEEESAPETHVK